MEKLNVGVNGFGRFGLHLLKFWLDHKETAQFDIQYINDDFLDIDKAHDIIMNDKYVNFNKYQINKANNCLTFHNKSGEVSKIYYTNAEKEDISWIGKVKLFLECTGKYATREEASFFLKGDTEKVIISQTSWDCDKTLIFGLNHEEYHSDQKLISYGSCTVNAFCSLANFVNKKYGVSDCDVNVIHNIPPYKLKDPKSDTLVRKFCTLEKSSPNLLNFINEKNFNVNYTLIPYDGVSIFDIRFKLDGRQITREDVISSLEDAFVFGPLKNLYAFDEEDRGPEPYICSPYSAVLIKENLKVKGDNLYLHCYFDNENSVNRYFDLVHFISEKVKLEMVPSIKSQKADYVQPAF